MHQNLVKERFPTTKERWGGFTRPRPGVDRWSRVRPRRLDLLSVGGATDGAVGFQFCILSKVEEVGSDERVCRRVRVEVKTKNNNNNDNKNSVQ